MNQPTWYEAAAYCNWLSEQEGIPKDQWCYEPNLLVKDDASRVLRGGSLFHLSSYVRSATRLDTQPSQGSDLYGFRAARTLPSAPLTSSPPTP